MKRIFVILALISVLFTGNIFSKDAVKPQKTTDVKIATDNLLRGVSSDNAGLRLSSAYFLGELKSEEALIPLMKMLRGDEKESGRIMAALSLFKLKSARAVYMLKREASFNSSERTREMCKKFYNAFLMDERAKKLKRNNITPIIAQSLR
ncbi:MAG: hypothetical protein GXO87_00355 [Chlorobi bacterium]|nr:hypothetical protein [Chlorobiota bacterium]